VPPPEMGAHVPSDCPLRACLQDWQPPVQGPLQQTPSVQTPLRHSPLPLQVAPLLFLAAQWLVESQ